MNDDEFSPADYIKLRPKMSSFKNLDRHLLALQDRETIPRFESRTKNLSISNIPEVYEFSKTESKEEPKEELLSDLYKVKISSVVTRHEDVSIAVLKTIFALSMVLILI